MDYVLDDILGEAGFVKWYLESNRPSTGNGYIQGSITINNAIITSGIVVIFEEFTNLYVNSMITNNGVFRFENLNENLQYYILVKYDDKEHKVQSRVNPAI